MVDAIRTAEQEPCGGASRHQARNVPVTYPAACYSSFEMWGPGTSSQRTTYAPSAWATDSRGTSPALSGGRHPEGFRRVRFSLVETSRGRGGKHAFCLEHTFVRILGSPSPAGPTSVWGRTARPDCEQPVSYTQASLGHSHRNRAPIRADSCESDPIGFGFHL